jgi:hypothetical protein
MRQIKVDTQAKSDIIEDLLAGFEWAYGLSPTEQERDKFRKDRDIEWQSGDATWQFPLVRIYRQAIGGTKASNPYRSVRLRQDYQGDFIREFKPILTDSLYRGVTDYDSYRASIHLEGKELLEAWVKKGKSSEKFVISKTKRAFYEKENTVLIRMEHPTELGGKFPDELSVPEVILPVENFNTKFFAAISLSDREEIAKRIIEDWKKNGSTNDNNPKNALQCLMSGGTYFKMDKFADFIKKGDIDGKWLKVIADKSPFWTSPISHEPTTNLQVLRDYAAFRVCQINQVAGQDIVPLTPPVKAVIVERTIQQWDTLSPSKKKEILSGTKLFTDHQNYWSYKIPLFKEHQCHLWGQDLVKFMPELKPIVEKRSAYFKNLAKKDPNWQAKADTEQQNLQQSIVQMQGEYLRGQERRFKSAMDDLVKSGHALRMNILENTKSQPNETYWYLKRINP